MSSYAKKILLIAALILLIAGDAFSLSEKKIDGWDIRLTGYIKNIFLYTEPIDIPANVMLGLPPNSPSIPDKISFDEHYDNYTRLRIRMSGKRGDKYAWELHYELMGIAMNPDFVKLDSSVNNKHTEQYLMLQDTLTEQPGYEISHRLDRAWFRWSPNWGEFVVGRQAITWTVGKLWFPLDRFSPFLPFDIDQDEKTGVDAVNVAFNLGALNSIRFIYAPLDECDETRAGALLKASLKGFDLQAMGGYFSEDRVFGGSVSHNIFGAVARVEYAYTNPENLKYDDRWSIVANADMGFGRDIYVAAEYFHQSAGMTNDVKYWRVIDMVDSLKLAGFAQDYAGIIFSYSVTPLLKPSIVSVINLNDGSYFLGPKIEYKPVENLTLAAGANLFFASDKRSELGMNPDILYGTVKVFF